MPCLQSVLLCCLLSTVLCHTGPEAERHAESEEDAGAGDLQTWKQQQASTINSLRAELTTYKSQVDGRLDSYNNRLDSYNNRLDSYNNRLDSYYLADSCRNQPDNEVGSLKNQVDSYKNQMDSYKNQVDAQVDSYKSQVDVYKSQVDAYKSQMDFLDSQLQMMQRKRNDGASRSVAFSARISASLDNGGNGLSLGHHQTIIFGDVVTNIGDAYNNDTGVFTAPVNGTYVFFLNQMVPNSQANVYLAIVKNGAVLDMVFSGNDDNYDQGSSLVSVVLADGDHVWVRQWKGGAVRGQWWTIFTGFLLHAE